MYLGQQPHTSSMMTEQQLWENPSATPQVLNVSCEKAFRDSSQLKLRTDLHTTQGDVSSAEKAMQRPEETPQNYSAVSQNSQTVLGLDNEQKNVRKSCQPASPDTKLL